MPGTPETVIAFDFGLRRIGVAVGQQVTSSARPLAVIGNGAGGPDWQHIESVLREWRPDRIIVGMPAHADGSPAEHRRRWSSISSTNCDAIDLPLETVDERYTSVDAEDLLKSQRAEGLRGKVSKDLIDSTAAAALIAERWLKKEY